MESECMTRERMTHDKWEQVTEKMSSGFSLFGNSAATAKSLAENEDLKKANKLLKEELDRKIGESEKMHMDV